MAAIVGGGEVARRPMKTCYCGHGGWKGNTWGGMKRIGFVFSDTQVGGCLYAGGCEGQIVEGWSKADLARILPNGSFGGIVCVAN